MDGHRVVGMTVVPADMAAPLASYTSGSGASGAADLSGLLISASLKTAVCLRCVCYANSVRHTNL